MLASLPPTLASLQSWATCTQKAKAAAEVACGSEGPKQNRHSKRGTMKRNYLLVAVALLLAIPCSVAAQDQKTGTLGSVEFQKVKNNNVPQYEAGRKQKAAWHKQQNDPLPLLVW